MICYRQGCLQISNVFIYWIDSFNPFSGVNSTLMSIKSITLSLMFWVLSFANVRFTFYYKCEIHILIRKFGNPAHAENQRLNKSYSYAIIFYVFKWFFISLSLFSYKSFQVISNFSNIFLWKLFLFWTYLAALSNPSIDFLKQALNFVLCNQNDQTLHKQWHLPELVGMLHII